MNFDSPEYGYSVLSKVFSSGEIEIRDHNKLKSADEEDCFDRSRKMRDRGILVLAYLDKYSLAANIQYFPDGKIYFKIDHDQRLLVDSYFKPGNVNDSVYDYFLFILNKIMADVISTTDHCHRFNYDKSWIELDKKLSKIIA